MHELGIAQGILSVVLSSATNARAGRVNFVDVSVGDLTEVMEDALQFAWEELRKDTVAAEAALRVTMVPATSHCMDCGYTFGHSRYDGARCPSCGSFIISLVTGRELSVDSIDVD